MTCFLVVFWFENLQFWNRLSILVLWGLNMKNLDCVCCFSELENWKKIQFASLFLGSNNMQFFFSCENDVGICMLFF